jgi:hypothetical protein
MQGAIERIVTMNEETEKLIVSALLHTGGFDRLMIVDNLEDVNMDEADFVVIRAHGCDDPVYLFWQIHEKKVLADGCRIVFTGVSESPSWKDLTEVFNGTKFGNLYLMCYRKDAKVGVLPSQRGMYMK